MCDRLGQLREAMGRYAASFDACLLSSEQATVAVAEAPAIEHHHHLKSLGGWGLADGHGKRAFVPPDDPRHPGASPAAESAA